MHEHIIAPYIPVIYFVMSLLESYGWNLHFENNYTSYKVQGLEVGRVVAIQGFKHTLISQSGSIDTLLSGALMNSRENEELPKVGDWVVFKSYEEQGIILEVLPRHNELSRKSPGKVSSRQVITTNIDYAFIIQGLDRDFNLMRLQRYLQQILQCNILPIVILNKKDLVDDPGSYLQQVQELGYQCPVLLTSALDKEDLNVLATQYLQPAKTYVLLGSSGVGKSTLLNTLLGYHLQEEGSTSTANSKGKHTTTSRNLIMLPNGSMLIDSPGMREFGVTLEADAPGVYHPQIDELSAHCRFRDCTHQHEPDCAVVAAANDGSLPQLVYRSYLKLLREQYHFQENAAEKKRIERQFGRMSKQINAHRKNRKY